MIHSPVLTRSMVFSFVLLSAALTLAACTDVVRVEAPASSGLTVSGEGKVMGEPDLAVLNVGVETRARVAQQAVQENEAQMSRLVSSLKSLGIGERDVQTSNYSINFERYRPFEPPAPMEEPAPAVAPRLAPAAAPESAGPTALAPPESQSQGWFSVNNTLTIRVRQLNNLGRVLGVATTAGANNVWGIEFRIEDPSGLRERARSLAIADAMVKAKRMAETSGAKLGPLLSMDEGGHGGPSPAGMPMAAMKMAEASISVESGSLEVAERVSLRFALLPLDTAPPSK